jgi:hypothetical protein
MRFYTITEFVDAVQFWPEKKPWPEGVKVASDDFWGEPNPNFYYFENDDEAYEIKPGHWVITNESGYQWACSTETLGKKFQPVDDCPDWDLNLEDNFGETK